MRRDTWIRTGAALRALRERQGDWLTGARLGALARVSRSLVNKVEKGERPPTVNYLQRIAPYLRVSAEELLELAGFQAVRPAARPVLENADPIHEVESAIIRGGWPVEVSEGVKSMLTRIPREVGSSSGLSCTYRGLEPPITLPAPDPALPWAPDPADRRPLSDPDAAAVLIRDHVGENVLLLPKGRALLHEVRAALAAGEAEAAIIWTLERVRDDALTEPRGRHRFESAREEPGVVADAFRLLLREYARQTRVNC